MRKISRQSVPMNLPQDMQGRVNREMMRDDITQSAWGAAAVARALMDKERLEAMIPRAKRSRFVGTLVTRSVSLELSVWQAVRNLADLKRVPLAQIVRACAMVDLDIVTNTPGTSDDKLDCILDDASNLTYRTTGLNVDARHAIGQAMMRKLADSPMPEWFGPVVSLAGLLGIAPCDCFLAIAIKADQEEQAERREQGQ